MPFLIENFCHIIAKNAKFTLNAWKAFFQQIYELFDEIMNNFTPNLHKFKLKFPQSIANARSKERKVRAAKDEDFA